MNPLNVEPFNARNDPLQSITRQASSFPPMDTDKVKQITTRIIQSKPNTFNFLNNNPSVVQKLWFNPAIVDKLHMDPAMLDEIETDPANKISKLLADYPAKLILSSTPSLRSARQMQPPRLAPVESSCCTIS